MFRLATTLFSLISTTLMGTFIVVVLVMGYDTLVPILIAAAVGFVAALPISWFIAKQIYENA
ncbi:CTP synthetase [Donghicola sp.]|jgi:preprotein translocase subunit SecF|uniref:CTP synthetase n=1 Tax=Donghicola sp. TaxID=1929294 RepID=UPI0025FAFD79|nr:CTP synthetase [Donghicola sp.]MCT4577803.1 CTP synthetase [Donghicola sp.]